MLGAGIFLESLNSERVTVTRPRFGLSTNKNLIGIKYLIGIIN